MVSHVFEGMDPDTRTATVPGDDPPTWSISPNNDGAFINSTSGAFTWIVGDQYEDGDTVSFNVTLTDPVGDKDDVPLDFTITNVDDTPDVNEEPAIFRYVRGVLEGSPIPSLSELVRDPVEIPPDGDIRYELLDISPSLPDDVDFDENTGDFDGSFPFNTTDSDPGFIRYEITWMYTDGSGAVPEEQFGSLRVNNDNREPVIGATPSFVSPSPGDTLQFTMTGDDPDTDSATGEAAPTWSISPNDDGAEIGRTSGLFTWTPHR